MNPQKLAQYAALCVEELDAHSGSPLSVRELSLRKGIPLPECIRVMKALGAAGIIKLNRAQTAVLLRQDVTALELLQAVWSCPTEPQRFQMLLGGHHGKTMEVTRSYVTRSATTGEEAING